MEQLFTVWGETLDKEHVLDEYPRPLMVRDRLSESQWVLGLCIYTGICMPERI